LRASIAKTTAATESSGATMLPPKPMTGSADEQRLQRLFKRLDEADRHALLQYAEFLADRGEQRDAPETRVPVEPRDIPRPRQETVIAAIRRLTETYPMLPKGLLLHDTADLMSAHVLQGREAAVVIDELESVFRRHYEQVNSGEAPGDD
jgi:hypothetical protein